MQQLEKELAEKRLDDICSRFLNQCPLYFRHITVGDPPKEILRFIRDEKIDRVVMASRGSEAHFDFGSVAERVLKCTIVPIVTIPV